MVWIHGGGFATGSSIELYAYDGMELADFGDVVVVSLNHRLNCIGYSRALRALGRSTATPATWARPIGSGPKVDP